MSQAPRRRPATTLRILWSTGAGVLLLLLLQNLFGAEPRAAVIGHAAVAAWIFGWNMPVLRSVRTAVVLLIALSVAATLGTLTVQRSHLPMASDEEFFDTYAFATAHLWIKATHPLPRAVELTEANLQRLDQLRAAFGDEVADEEEEGLRKGLVAMRDEAAAHELAERRRGLLEALFSVASGLRFTDLYRAWWFHGLFFLLAANLAVGAVMRRKLSVRNLGFHCAHLGLVVIVAGATGGAFLGQRGMAPLEVGRGVSSFLDENTRGVVPLGFTVRLDRFDTVYHEDLVIEQITGGNDPHHGMMGGGGEAPLRHSVKLEQGSTFELGDPDGGEATELEMLEIIEAVGLHRERREATEGEDGAPSVRFTPAYPDPRAGAEGLWLGQHDGIYIDPTNRYKLRIEPLPEGLFPEGSGCADDRHGLLTLTPPGDAPASVPITPGATFELAGLRGEVLELVPDFRVGADPGTPADFPRNPALRMRLTDAGGGGGEFLLFSDPRLKGFTSLPWEGMEASFDYDYWCAPTGHRIRLLVEPRAGATVHAVLVSPEGGVRSHPVPHGTSLPLGEGALLVHEALGRATEQITPIPADDDDGPGAPPTHTALRLAITGPDGAQERWLLSDTADGVVRVGEFAVMLASNTDRPPRDWRSHLSILEEGIVVATGVAEVNKPVHYRGYGFFQSDADPRRPEYSGLQVVKDPAWTPVKLGLWMLLLGIAWIFYVQPLFDRKKTRAEEAP